MDRISKTVNIQETVSYPNFIQFGAVNIYFHAFLHESDRLEIVLLQRCK